MFVYQIKKMKRIVLASFVFCSINLIAQPGTLDSDFDGDGKVFTDVNPGFREEMYGIATQPDGKVVACGTAIFNTFDMVVVRYNPDGSLDNNFNTTGIATHEFGAGSDVGKDIIVLSDGKILVGGWSRPVNGFDFTLVRYTTGGQLDNTFGVGGIVTLDFGNDTDDLINDIAVQPDGKIVAAGTADGKCAVARFNYNGTLDNTFSFDGKLTTDVGPGESQELNKVIILPNGKILAIGSVGANTSLDGIIIRYNADGTLDTGFDNDGRLRVDAANQQADRFKDAILLSDGKILLGGYAYVQSDIDFLLVKLNDDGTFDQTFDSDGIVTTNLAGSSQDIVESLVVEPGTNKIIAGGDKDYIDVAVVRYMPNGTIDNTWANNGQSVIDLQGNLDDNLSSICLQPDGKLLACGYTKLNSSDNISVVWRYLTGLTIGVVDFSQNNIAPLLYPNPLRAIETLKYTLKEQGQISISLHDNQGKLIHSFVTNETQQKGEHELDLTMPENLGTGTYFITISSAKGMVSIKAVK